MSIALNVMVLMICINLFLYLGYLGGLVGTCTQEGTFCTMESSSPASTAINLLARIAGDSTISWGDVLCQSIESLPIIITITAVIIALSFATGTVTIGLTAGVGGGGYGAVHALTIIAVAIFMTFVNLPNITCLNFPTEVSFIIRIILGGFIALSIFGLMRGE